MITNFQVSSKTKRPACCDFSCCGNHFGRIYRSCFRHDSHPNRIIRARRYAKHVEKQSLRAIIDAEVEYLRDEIAAYERMRDE